MRRPTRLAQIATTLAAVPLLAVVAPSGPAPAEAAPPSKPTALVTLGDSYISGEAGRWLGNSAVLITDRRGTDRAFVPPLTYDATGVYGNTSEGCDRSDVAPALSSDVAVDVKLNIACSGARTTNVIQAAHGGAGQHGERPQTDQLADLAASHDIEFVVLSIGGNDLGFAGIIQACLTAYTTTLSRCAPEQQRAVDARMPAAMDGVRQAIDDVRSVLAAVGQWPNSYRFVLQSYPSPIPRAAENRYHELSPARQAVGGCPISDSDSDWARDQLVPQISNALAAVALEKRVQFLDLSDAFQGREACSTEAEQSDGSPSGATDEWTRFLTPGLAQGTVQESLHPNAFGQQAMGRCYTMLMAASASHDLRCSNTTGLGPEGMRVTRRP